MAERPTQDRERAPRSDRVPEEDERLEDLEPDEDEAHNVHGGVCRCAWCAYS